MGLALWVFITTFKTFSANRDYPTPRTDQWNLKPWVPENLYTWGGYLGDKN